MLAQRHQRAEVAVVKGQQRLAPQLPRDLPGDEAGLLVRGLRARRHVAGMAFPNAGGTVAQRVDGVVAAGLQRGAHDELVDAVGLESVDVAQEIRGLDARCPDHQFGGKKVAVGGAHAGGGDFGHALAGMHLHAEFGQFARGCDRQPLGQRGQDAGRGLDQAQAHVALGVDAVQAIGGQHPRGVMQLGHQFHPGGSGADGHDLELLRAQRLDLGVGGDAGIHQSPVKTPGVFGRVQRNGMLGRAGRAEVVVLTAHGDHQNVVADAPPRHDFAPGLI